MSGEGPEKGVGVGVGGRVELLICPVRKKNHASHIMFCLRADAPEKED